MFNKLQQYYKPGTHRLQKAIGFLADQRQPDKSSCDLDRLEHPRQRVDRIGDRNLYHRPGWLYKPAAAGVAC